MANTIVLKGDPVYKEAVANGAITPGHLLQFNSNDKIEVHGTAKGNAQPMFAIEEAVIGDDIDDAYAADDTVLYVVARPGDEINALLKNGENVAKGDFLESAGDGTLQKHTAIAANEGGSATYTIYTRGIVAMAMEDLNNTTGSAARIRVEAM